MTTQHDSQDLKQLLCFNVYALNRSFGRYYQAAFSETGLTYSKFVVLSALETDGPLSVSALSSRASVEPNTLSPVLKKMAEFGIITRQRAPDDERRVELAITPMGKEILQRAQSVIASGFAELDIEPGRLVDAMSFLEDTRAKLDEANPPKLSFDGLS